MSTLSSLAAICMPTGREVWPLMVSMAQCNALNTVPDVSCLVDDDAGVGIAAFNDQGRCFFHDQGNRISVAFSGRITNRKEIMGRIRGKGTISEDPDCAEIVACLYLERGTACMAFIHGYFCFLLWDGRKNELLAVRDHLGSYPLFYAKSRTGPLVVGNRIATVMSTGLVSKNLDIEGIAHYLHDKSFLQPSTPFRDVRSLPPGTFLRCFGDEHHIHRYYQPSMRKEPMEEVEAIDQADALLCTILEEQIAPFDRIGVCFSGGVDSLLIVAMLKSMTHKPIHTYTVCSQKDDGVSAFARESSRYFGTHQTMVEMDGCLIRDLLPDITSGYPTPAVGGWQIYLATRGIQSDGLNVGFSGHGAEISFGIDWHQMKFAQIHALSRFLALIPLYAQRSFTSWLRRYLDRQDKGYNRKYGNLHLLCDYLEKRLGIYYWNSSRLTERMIADVFLQEIGEIKSVGDMYRQCYEDSRTEDFIDQMLFARLVHFEGNHAQGKNNYLAQHNGVELVLPFMDRRFLEFGLSIPNNLKTRRGEYKYLEALLSKTTPSPDMGQGKSIH